MKNEWRALLSAVQFLTRLPVPDPGWEDRQLDRAAKWFPLVGALVGLICGGTLLLGLALGISQFAALFVAILAGIIATGALHEDGLADTADGLGGGNTPERRLTIMKDSAIGTYGALALIALLVLRLLLYSDAAYPRIEILSGNVMIALALIAAHTASRSAMVAVLWSLPYARAETDAKVTPLNEAGTTAGIAIVTVTAVLALIPLGIWVGFAAVSVALLIACLAAIALRALFAAKLGGWTGDTAGASQGVCEVAFLIGLTAWT